MRTVLLMWEHSCAYSPLWSRSDDLEIGPVDAADLGLPPELREDLADWNRRIEAVALAGIEDRDRTGLVEPAASEAFLLAARVQRGLGGAWTVWCCAGGGDGALGGEAWEHRRRSSGPHLLLERTGLHEWTPTARAAAAHRLDPSMRRLLAVWRAAADRLAPVEHRAEGLELCAALQAALPGSCLLWFGGADVPA